MFCKNCGKEIDDNSKFCMFCGVTLNEENIEEKSETIEKEKKPNIPIKKIGVLIAIEIALFAVIGISKSSLNANEKMAYECASDLRDKMKDPDSFKLYDEMFLLEYTNEKGTSSVLVFKYGGANSYGAILTDHAIYADGEYIMDYDEFSEMNESNTADFGKKFSATWPLSMWMMGSSNVEKIDIDVEKIKDKMGL